MINKFKSTKSKLNRTYFGKFCDLNSGEFQKIIFPRLLFWDTLYTGSTEWCKHFKPLPRQINVKNT